MGKKKGEGGGGDDNGDNDDNNGDSNNNKVGKEHSGENMGEMGTDMTTLHCKYVWDSQKIN